MPPIPLIVCIVLFAIALLIVVALSLRGSLTIEYKKELKVYFQILFIRIKLYPFPKKRTKHRVRHMSRWRARQIRRAAQRKAERKLLRRKAKKEKKLQKSSEKKKDEEKKSEFKLPSRDQISMIIDILKLVTEISAVTVKQFAKRLRIKTARLKVTVATPDPAVTAIAYGAVTQTVNILLPILSEVKNFKMPRRKNFDVSTSFTTDTPEFDLKISFSLRVWHLLDIPIAGIRKAAPELPKYIDMITKLLSPKKEEEPKDKKEKTPDGEKKEVPRESHDTAS